MDTFDDILEDLDAWACGRFPPAPSQPMVETAGPGLRPAIEADQGATAAAVLLTLSRGLYALAVAGSPAKRGLSPFAGTHIDVPPGQPRGSVFVLPTGSQRSRWLRHPQDVLIVKVHAQSGRLIITRYGNDPEASKSRITVLRLDEPKRTEGASSRASALMAQR